MPTQVFYPTDLDASIAPDSLFMGNDFPGEFLSLAALDKDYHQEISMTPMPFLPHNSGIDTVQTMAPSFEAGDEPEETQDRPRLRNRTLRPAPRGMRKDSMGMKAGMNQQQPFFDSYQPRPSFPAFSFNSNSTPDADFTFDPDRDRASPHSDPSSNPSTSPIQWHRSTNETEKRAKHLERNRAAASKSRQKKKRETDQLRSRFQEASRRKSGLEVEIKELHSQLLSLKDQILMHSRCDDEAIRMHLGRMVKQAARHDSASSASILLASNSEINEISARRHSRDQVQAGSTSPAQEDAADLRPRGQNSEPDMTNSQQFPVSMDNASLPCGVEKPMLDPMFSQPQGNIFDLQMSVN
ncbi:bZIP transcription factor [Aspergillus undulatus]|uniref:bZIP transcription factor n=1 Tax=Aspergillus undulatus TaxID=1810928 RepID=UPI003CCD2ACC